jgi:hypothetical protein
MTPQSPRVAVWGVVGVIHVKIYRSHKGTCPNQG